MNKASVWFLGTSTFAVPSLHALAKDPAFRVDLIITQPDRPVGRKKELTPPPVKIAAQKLGLKIEQPENINAAPVPEPNPDFLVVISYGQILSQRILNLARVAPVNVHASLLPRWRGASPIQHAILMGDAKTGVTVQKMIKELDAGPILAQESMPLDERETYLHLHDALAVLGADLLTSTLKKPLTPKQQDENTVTFCRKLSRGDGVIDPETMKAEDIDRRVRALNPWPSVTLSDGLKLLVTSLEPEEGSIPLSCAAGTTLHLVMVQAPGGKPMSGAEWKRGQQ